MRTIELEEIVEIMISQDKEKGRGTITYANERLIFYKGKWYHRSFEEIAPGHDPEGECSVRY